MEYVSREDVDEHLIPVLRSYTVSVRFIKTDGTVRTMLCTLKPDLLPVKEMVETEDSVKVIKKPNPDIQMVYDLEAKAWRSFNKNNVCGYSTLAII